MNTRRTDLPASQPDRGTRPTWPPLRRDALCELGATGFALLVVSMMAAHLGGLGADYSVKASALYAACAVVLWRALGSGSHPHARFGSANRVTLSRLALGVMLAALVGEDVASRPPASTAFGWSIIVLATITALLDAVDGTLARRSGLASAFGARFDMETDAAYTLVLCVLVWQSGQAGPWVFGAGLMRYAFVAAARCWPWLGGPLAPSRRRQTVCVVQITVLIVCLGPIIPPTVASALAAVSLFLLAGSFIIDIHALARERRTKET